MSYEDYIRNMTKYMNVLPLTKVKLFYFHAKDLTKPQIKDQFKRFLVNNISYFITHGIHRNFWYIYKESDIKYLIEVDREGYFKSLEMGVGDVNNGDHIDIDLLRLRDGDVVVKNHKTIYTYIGDLTFDRSAPECNFLMKLCDTSSEDTFAKTKCVTAPNNEICGAISMNFGKPDRDVILQILQVMKGEFAIDGRKKKNKKEIDGGDAFLKDFSENFLKPLSKYRDDLMEVFVMDANKDTLLVFVDSVEYTRNIFWIDKSKLQDKKYLKSILDQDKSIYEREYMLT